MALVDLQQAKAHLRITTNDGEEDIRLKMELASEIVLDYLKTRGGVTWTSNTVPGPVQSATLLMLTHLYEHRGDDMATDDKTWEAIGRLLWRSRDPALA